MTNERLTNAIEALLYDRGLLRRFRRDPGRALRRFHLSETEFSAVRSGDVHALVALGLDPKVPWPDLRPRYGAQTWLLRNARRLTPAALIAGAAMAMPAASVASVPRSTLFARARHIARSTPGLSRAFTRYGGAPALSRALLRAGVSPSRARAIVSRTRSVFPPPAQ